MLIDMPDRNIPVKHIYTSQEFVTSPVTDKFRDMNNVASIRKSKGLSQAELADLAGVEQPTISKLERGNESVTLRTLGAVAAALDVPLADLFVERTDAERAIIDAYRSLPELRKRGWLDLARTVASDNQGDLGEQD